MRDEMLLSGEGFRADFAHVRGVAGVLFLMVVQMLLACESLLTKLAAVR